MLGWDAGSQEVKTASENNDDICANHEDCGLRPTQIKLTKGFTAKEHVNVVKGLKLYESIFTDSELSKLTDFVDELRVAGQNGELSGETFILFNKQVKGNKRELIQLGVPIFGHIKEEAAGNNPSSNIEPIPALLQGVIDHLVQWQLIPEYKKPNGCIIHFFDEEEYSQPFLKPPHLDQPISTLILSESTMAFGRILGSDSDGNYRGSLSLFLKKGYVCLQNLCKEYIASPSPYPVPNGALDGYEPMDSMPPNWGVLSSPVVMLAPVRPIGLESQKNSQRRLSVLKGNLPEVILRQLRGQIKQYESNTNMADIYTSPEGRSSLLLYKKVSRAAGRASF
ncbi:hypothetical protein POTOM_060462 [Populus tomentosa]|uniref:Isopenicillin N synthase-like Fe(2+) 2OG dioxygenase domain-containing protein n=1 Tax=Populus tomentosa TaxID=118781 RepID=A0A8X7XZZ0_POPTO|nr:hypothetical protein POTOM_060462 [Populus tomentosa]